MSQSDQVRKDLRILVDADACPVKDEIYKVAYRTGVPVVIVSGSGLRIPPDPQITQVIAGDGFDAADDHIAGIADDTAIVVTGDILLADRCLKVGATVIAPTGKPFTSNSIGGAIAVRAIMADLRAGAANSTIGGPAPFGKQDRSRFLSALDAAIVRLRRS